MTTQSNSQFKSKLETKAHVLRMIIDGLEGKPFAWQQCVTKTYMPKSRTLGITLVSKTGAAKRGYQLKPRAAPVGSIYQGAPIQKYIDVYVLECQCVLKAEKSVSSTQK